MAPSTPETPASIRGGQGVPQMPLSFTAFGPVDFAAPLQPGVSVNSAVTIDEDEARKHKVAAARARRATVSPTHRSMNALAPNKHDMDDATKESASRLLETAEEEPTL